MFTLYSEERPLVAIMAKIDIDWHRQQKSYTFKLVYRLARFPFWNLCSKTSSTAHSLNQLATMRHLTGRITPKKNLLISQTFSTPTDADAATRHFLFIFASLKHVAHSAFGAGQNHARITRNPSRPQVAGGSLCAKLQKFCLLFALTTATQRGVAIKASVFLWFSWTRASVLAELTRSLKVLRSHSSTAAIDRLAGRSGRILKWGFGWLSGFANLKLTAFEFDNWNDWQLSKAQNQHYWSKFFALIRRSWPNHSKIQQNVAAQTTVKHGNGSEWICNPPAARPLLKSEYSRSYWLN